MGPKSKGHKGVLTKGHLTEAHRGDGHVRTEALGN